MYLKILVRSRIVIPTDGLDNSQIVKVNCSHRFDIDC